MIHLDLTVHKDNLMLTTTHELYQPYTRDGTEDKNKSENKLIKDFFYVLPNHNATQCVLKISEEACHRARLSCIHPSFIP